MGLWVSGLNMKIYIIWFWGLFFVYNTAAIELDTDGLTNTKVDMFKEPENIRVLATSSNINNSVILQESVPVRDSINYNSILSFRFEPNLDDEWTHSYQILIYLSGSLCKLPNTFNTTMEYNGLSLFYTFNKTIAEDTNLSQMESASFTNGYVEALAEVSMAKTSDYNLYIFIVPDDCANCTTDSAWLFEFAASQKNILFLYDTEPIVSVVDVDYDSVIFEAEEIVFGNNRSFELLLFKDQYPVSTALNQSLCAISSSTAFSQKIAINETNAEGSSNYFIVSDLEIGSSYSAVLLMTFSDKPYGGGIFQPFNFTTSKTKACKLAYDLDFCDEVAYAVPISENYLNGDETWENFVAAYDNYTEELYQPFEYAMQQIACDTEADARYSPIRTCENCKYSYKQWLCSVSIPRCVTPINANSQNKLYEAGEGRNSFISNTISPPLPYAEVMPCLNVCQAIVRDCPADFSFECPKEAELVKLSYGDPDLDSSDELAETYSNEVSTVTADNSFYTYRICNFLGQSNIPNITSTL